MLELLFAFGIFLLAFLGLAVGVLNGRRGITGSCGGLAQLPGLATEAAHCACRGQGECQRKPTTTQQECPSHSAGHA
jgi:hypothetical protein